MHFLTIIFLLVYWKVRMKIEKIICQIWQTSWTITSRHITKVRKKSSGSPAGSCQQCKRFGNLLFPREQNHHHTILQIVPLMKHSECFYSSTTSPKQKTRNQMIHWRRMKRKRMPNKVMEMEKEMQNKDWQPRINTVRKEQLSRKIEKSTRRFLSGIRDSRSSTKQKPTTENSFPSAIEDHCNIAIQKIAADKHCIHKIDIPYDPCILLTTKFLKWNHDSNNK